MSPSIFPSGGACDEEIIIYLNELTLKDEEIEVMKNKTFGEEGSDEVITLNIQEFSYENVIKNVSSGSIIVFHDSLKAKENIFNSLEKTIETLKNKGFNFEKIA